MMHKKDRSFRSTNKNMTSDSPGSDEKRTKVTDQPKNMLTLQEVAICAGVGLLGFSVGALIVVVSEDEEVQGMISNLWSLGTSAVQGFTSSMDAEQQTDPSPSEWDEGSDNTATNDVHQKDEIYEEVNEQ
jgi:predicted phage tail protein